MDQFVPAPVKMATMSDVLAVSQGAGSAREIGLTLNRIYFLDLKAVRQTLGHTRWTSKRAVVHGVTKACINRVADQDDVCVQLGEDQYVLIFATDNIEQIANRCSQIANSIEEKLFGQKGLNRVVIRDATSVFAEGAVIKDDTDRPADQKPELADEIAPKDDRDHQNKMDAVMSDNSRKSRRAELLNQLTDEEEDALTYGYLPIWHAREGRIMTHMCQPRRGSGPHAQTGYDVIGHNADATATAKLDTHGIEECLYLLKELKENDNAVHLMPSVHFETLANRSTRMELQEFLSVVPKRFGQRLTLHLCGVPTGIPETRLTEITANLTNWVSNVSVTIKMSECPTLQELGARSWQYGRAKIGVIGIDFEDVISDESLARAKRLAAVLGPRGLKLAATNVPSSPALCELSTSDFLYLSGDPIGGFQPRPGPPRQFTMRDLERA